MKVSVVIPTRNRLAFLQEAIASIQAQTYSDWEAIIVDDASTDGTWQWLNFLRKPRVRAFHLEHHSERSAARNFGLAQARGEAVMFLDDDDRLLPGALRTLSDLLVQNPDAIAAVGGRVRIELSGRRNTFFIAPWATKRVIWPEVLLFATPGQGEALIRRTILAAAGGWKEGLSFAEDYELWLRISRLGPIAFTRQIVFELRVHSGRSRPAGRPLIVRNILSNFLASLPEKERRFGERLVVARRAISLGDARFRRANHAKAFASLFQAVWSVPELLASPIAGSFLAWMMLRCIAHGSCGFDFVRLLRRLRLFTAETVNGA
jgi:glycosyltransferase involved in cell wall biosynthesis